MKKIFSIALVIIGIFLIMTALSACNKNDSNTLKIALDIEDRGRYDELFSYFTEKTGIEVAATYGEDISKLVGTADEPDIIKTSSVVVSSMKGSLVDLTSFIEADEQVSTDIYLDSIMEALTIDGKIYALPTSLNTSLLYYNKKLFDVKEQELREAFNLDASQSVYPKPDWDYDDFVKAGVILSEYTIKGDKRVYTQFGCETQLNWWGEWLVYVYQMGGTFYLPNSNNRVSALTSEQVIAATEFFRKKSLGDEHEKFAPDAIEASSAFSFLNGNVAMILGGHMGDWNSYNTIGLDWDIQLLPTPVGKPDAVGGEIAADAFGISARSKKKQVAFEFLKTWAGEEGAKQMYKYGKVGVLKNMEQIINALPEKEQKSIDIGVVFNAIERARTLPNEKDFSKICREKVMTEIYKLMYEGRGSEDDVRVVLNRIKENVDSYYQNLYG